MILLFTLISCKKDPAEQTFSEITITDAVGRTISFSSLPERIVIGGNGALMIADALLAFPEGRQRLVAYTKTDQGKGSFTEILLPDSNAELIEDRTSVEVIAAYNPDVVLLKSYMSDLGNTLGEVGIPVVYLDLETYEQYQLDMRNLGQLLGNETRAEELLVYYANIVSDIEEKVADIPENEKPTVLFAYYDSKDGAVALKVPPLNWAQTTILQRAGGIPVWKEMELDQKWTVISFEQIAAWNPDYIFLTAYFENVDDVKMALIEDPQWKELGAVQNQQLIAYPMAFYSWDQPHTRWGIIQEWAAYQLHPEIFSQFDFTEEAIDFYQLFYGWNSEKYMDIIQPILQGDIQ
jgi:iron complex transport system substrate-binding protein